MKKQPEKYEKINYKIPKTSSKNGQYEIYFTDILGRSECQCGDID